MGKQGGALKRTQDSMSEGLDLFSTQILASLMTEGGP